MRGRRKKLRLGIAWFRSWNMKAGPDSIGKKSPRKSSCKFPCRFLLAIDLFRNINLVQGRVLFTGSHEYFLIFVSIFVRHWMGTNQRKVYNTAVNTYAAWATAKHISSSLHLSQRTRTANGFNTTGITKWALMKNAEGFVSCLNLKKNINSSLKMGHAKGNVVLP